jgi:hypothetical protein
MTSALNLTSKRPMTDRENQRLAILSFIDANPGAEAGQIGVALAPAGTPDQRAWAVANIAPILLGRLVSTDQPRHGSIRLKLTRPGRSALKVLTRRSMVAAPAPASVEPDPAVMQRRAAPPWIAMALDGRITPRHEDAAQALSDAISSASSDGRPWISEAIDQSPDHGSAQLAALRRVLTATRLTRDLHGDQASVVVHVVIHERPISAWTINGVQARRSAKVMELAIGHLRSGLDIVAEAAGIAAPRSAAVRAVTVAGGVRAAGGREAR